MHTKVTRLREGEKGGERVGGGERGGGGRGERGEGGREVGGRGKGEEKEGREREGENGGQFMWSSYMMYVENTTYIMYVYQSHYCFPPISIQNDVIPESGSMRVIHGETSIVLMIDNLNSGNKGSYRCNATNSRSNDEGISIVECTYMYVYNYFVVIFCVCVLCVYT